MVVVVGEAACMRNAVQDDFLDEGTALFFKHIDDGIVFFGLAISRYEQVIFVDGQTLRRHGGADIRCFVFMMERQSGIHSRDDENVVFRIDAILFKSRSVQFGIGGQSLH
ncbi:hypothetical protein SDC9_73261 [bioreactor metagenome]|uniref:Uncharacterized protein n=1 Tax=bioreactor metagenome TaxID=1076179 RepID=A0A644YE34_9ZZZZ